MKPNNPRIKMALFYAQTGLARPLSNSKRHHFNAPFCLLPRFSSVSLALILTASSPHPASHFLHLSLFLFVISLSLLVPRTFFLNLTNLRLPFSDMQFFFFLFHFICISFLIFICFYAFELIYFSDM